MKFRTLNNRTLALLLLATVAMAAQSAGAAVVDYVGFAWETGGFTDSQPGDELSVATVVTQIDPLFQVDLGTGEATLYMEGLASMGAVVDQATGTITTEYSGGTIALYADPTGNHDWGTNPPSITVPGTFTDGDLVFAGEFTSFVLIQQSSGSGIFQGTINATGGSALAGPCVDCAYTIAGTFNDLTGANIPAGYDLQVDGLLDVESAVGVETLNWGSLKQLFNN